MNVLAAITAPPHDAATPTTAAAGDHVGEIYVVYGAVAVALTVWLAVILFRNGKTFLHDVFSERQEMGEAVNRLLVVGFFMLNLGYAFLLLQAEPTTSNEEAIRQLVNRLGLLLVSLGIIHFVNMAVFWKIRRRGQMETMPPPIPPQAVVRPNPPPPPAPAPRWTPAGHPTEGDGEVEYANDDYGTWEDERAWARRAEHVG